MQLDSERLLDRFRSRIEKRAADECWPWLGPLRNGYGYLCDVKRAIYAHRFAYELAYGPIPNGTQIHHTCGCKTCMNPAHLTTLTLREHITLHRQEVLAGAKRLRKLPTHCKHGHLYTVENTRLAKDGSRQCKTCQRIWARAAYHRKRAKQGKSVRANSRTLGRCRQGHSYPQNQRYDCNGHSYCARCAQIAQRRYRARAY